MRKFHKQLLVFFLLILGFGSGRYLRSFHTPPSQIPAARIHVSSAGKKKATQDEIHQSKKTMEGSTEESRAHQIPRQPSLDAFLESAKGEKLYSFLFNTKSLRSIPMESLLNVLERRFNSSYPDPVNKHGDPRHQETVARLGFLKAVPAHYDWKRLNASERRSYVQFHKNIATNPRENLMVQVQAARNLRAWMSSLDHSDRMAEQKNIPPRVLALASQSDRQLAQEVMDHDE